MNGHRGGIPIGSISASRVVDLFLFCYVRVVMLSHSDKNQVDIKAFNFASGYQDTLLLVSTNGY